MDYFLLFIEVITPLLIALAVLWADRRLRDNDEFDSVLDSLIGELCQNLAIARTIKSGIAGKIDLMEKGGWSRMPDPLFSEVAYKRAVGSETFFSHMRKSQKGFVRQLMEYYTSQEVVNCEIGHVNDVKFNFLVYGNIQTKVLRLILEQQKKTLELVIEPDIIKILDVLSSMNVKYRQTINLYSLGVPKAPK